MKNLYFLVITLLVACASGFAPSLFGFGRTRNTICFAKHVNDKAARWAASKRPKKSRPSDINRKAPEYALTSLVKPAEYSIDPAAAQIAEKPKPE